MVHGIGSQLPSLEAADPALPTDTEAASPADTLPDTAHIIFAKLIPLNNEACRAYSTVVDNILNNDPHLTHVGALMQFTGSQSSLRDALRLAKLPTSDSEPDSLSSFCTESDGDIDKQSGTNARPSEMDVEKLWTGYYAFHFAAQGSDALVGSRVGCGRWSSVSVFSDASVDFMLCYPKQHGVRNVHAVFKFDPRTGILMITALRTDPVRLNNDVFANGQSRAMNRRVSTLRFGSLGYLFTYTIEPHSKEEVEFQSAKADYFKNTLNSAAPPTVTSATPSLYEVAIADWILYDAVGKGASGTVSAASNKYGDVVAFKRFERDSRRGDSMFQQELTAAEKLKPLLDKHDSRSRIIRLRKAIYQRGKRDFDGGAPEIVCILYTPLAIGTLNELVLMDPKVEEVVRFNMFKQIVEGLEVLHQLRWLHRDLKPVNIGVLSTDPPRVVILDLGSATYVPHDKHVLPQPGRQGTVWYLAPEMESRPYDMAVDVWAAGVIGHELFFHSHPWKYAYNPWLPARNPNYEADVRRHGQVLDQLKASGQGSIGDLISRMLAWDPTARLSASQVLSHPSLSHIVTTAPEPPKDYRTGDKRKPP